MSIYINWAKIREPPPFGRYWFLVDNVIFSPKGGIQFILRILREKENVRTSALKECPKCGSPLDQNLESNPPKSEDEVLSLNDLARELQNKFTGVFGQPSEWWENTKPHLTLSNVIKISKLIILLIVALITGIGTFIQTLVPKVNKTIFALSHFLGQSMPFLLACLNTFNKIIGGFFLIFTMMWKDMIYGKRPNNAGIQHEKSQLSLEDSSSKSTNFPTVERGANNPYIRKPRYPYLRNEIQRPYYKSPSPS